MNERHLLCHPCGDNTPHESLGKATTGPNETTRWWRCKKCGNKQGMTFISWEEYERRWGKQKREAKQAELSVAHRGKEG